VNPPTHCLLVCTEEAERYAEALCRRNLPNLRVRAPKVVEDAGANYECTILMGDPHRIRPILASVPHLRWVQSNYSGVAPLLESACRRDYILTNVGPLYGPAVSEYVLCYLLMHERRAWQRYQAQLQNRWDGTCTSTLRGKRIGIMGVGNNGCQIAEATKNLGMLTRGLTRTSTNCPFVDDYYHGDQLIEFVSNVDYLVCVLPDSPQTRNLVTRDVLEAMPARALLVNVGRGSAIDDKALVEALQGGTIAGAVLDVFREEPLPPGHPFWSTPNIILTGHTAAPGPGFNSDVVEVFVENYQRLIAGLPLLYVVDWSRGY